VWLCEAKNVRSAGASAQCIVIGMFFSREMVVISLYKPSDTLHGVNVSLWGLGNAESRHLPARRPSTKPHSDPPICFPVPLLVHLHHTHQAHAPILD